VVGGLNVVAATPAVQAVARDQHIDQVILVSGAMTWESFDHLLRGITVGNKDTFAIKVSPGLYETLTTGVRVSYKNRVPLLEIERAPITGIDLLLKTALDFTVGVLLLPVTLVLGALIALTLVLLGRRPIVQSSRMLGKNGEVFKSYLFDACRPDEAPWKRGGGFGRLLYETGLEKIPQVWNLLSGKMSLVGPRPVDPKNAALFEEWLPNLLSLKPGMTGARASSPVNVITLDQEMRLELYYARNYSIWLDLQILFQTLVRILKRERVVREKVKTEPAGPSSWQLVTMSATRNEF
jgi:lipopolysaccharide/colanic/teichoic acid biosynthesis glycosyltransferase